MLGKQACAVNCVPFYRGAVNSVALKQPAVQSNFPLLHKLGLAEKAAKDPTIGSVCSLAGSKISSLFLAFSKPGVSYHSENFLFDLCSSWAFLEWYMTACKDFDFTPWCYRPKHKKKCFLRFGVFQVSMRVFWPPLRKGAGWP